MLQGNRSESERGAMLAQARPTLVARLRLFGMLAVLGPVFAGLNSLVLESVPQVEVRVIAAESTQPTPDVVVVERVVDRMVYVPVDNLSVTAPSPPVDEAHDTPVDRVGGAGIGETTDDTSSDAAADNPETEPAPAQMVAVRPVVYARPIATSEPVVEEVVESETEEASEESAAQVDEAPADEPVVAATSRPIIVHTMVWDGEQFVQSADATVVSPAMAESTDDVAAEAADVVGEDGEAVEGGETDEALVKIAEADADEAADDEVADAGEETQTAADDTGDIDEQVAADTDEPESATAEQQTDDAAQDKSADAAGEPEMIADVVGEVEEAVTAETSERLEQAVAAGDEPEDAVEPSDDLEQVAVEAAADEPTEDDATRARVQGAEAESTPTPTN